MSSVVDPRVAAAVKHNNRNVVWMSISFSLIYFGINTYRNFAVPLLGNLGSICLGLLYTLAAVGNLIIPTLLYVYPNVRNWLIISSFVMFIYILQYAYLIPVFALVMCCITGLFFAVSWSTQSILLAANSVDENRSRNSNLFYGIFMLGNVFGNGFAYILLNVIDIDLKNRGSGWNGGVSVLFIGLSISALIGSFLMFTIKPTMPTSFPDKDVEHGSRISSPEMNKRKSMKVESPSAWLMLMNKITAVVKCLFTKRMMLLFMLFINNGYGQVVVSSQITRQMKNVDQVGLAMAVYSIVEVITTVVCGYTADRLGNRTMIGIATLVEILGLVSTLYMNKHQGWWVFVPTAFFGIMDTIYQTECISILGRYFSDTIEDASATYRLVQGLGSSLCSYLTPLFISADATASTEQQLIVEMAVAGGISVLGYLFYLIFSCQFAMKKDCIMNS